MKLIARIFGGGKKKAPPERISLLGEVEGQDSKFKSEIDVVLDISPDDLPLITWFKVSYRGHDLVSMSGATLRAIHKLQTGRRENVPHRNR